MSQRKQLVTAHFEGVSWRVHYNTIRPHSALGYRPPAPEIIIPREELPMNHEAA